MKPPPESDQAIPTPEPSTNETSSTSTAPPLGDAQKFAFETIIETAKQIITLSTGLIALGILFAKDFAGGAPSGARVLLGLSWLFLLFSMLIAIFVTLGTVTGALGKHSHDEPANPYADNITTAAKLQSGFFLAGLTGSILAGAIMMM